MSVFGRTLLHMPLEPITHPAILAGAAAIAAFGYLLGGSRYVTLVHEAGHALTSILVGGGFQAIRIHSDGSGDTHAYTYSQARFIPVTAVGYLTPAFLGLAGTWAISRDHAAAALAVLAAISGLVLVGARNLLALGFATIGLAVSSSTFFLAGATIQLFVALTISLLLIGGGLFTAVRCCTTHSASDHELLQEMTGIPRRLWAIGTLAVNVWFTYAAVQLLLGF